VTMCMKNDILFLVVFLFLFCSLQFSAPFILKDASRFSDSHDVKLDRHMSTQPARHDISRAQARSFHTEPSPESRQQRVLGLWGGTFVQGRLDIQL